MSRGYSLRMAEAIRQADENNLGVQLGRVCLARDISVAQAAKVLNVSRQTMYFWFTGLSEPRDKASDDIRAYLITLG